MELREFFEQHPRAVLGFSGGVDSSYLLYAGKKYGADIRPIFIKSVFQPDFELEDARRLAEQVGAELTVIEVDVLQNQEVAANPPDRCYYCKNGVFGRITAEAKALGYPLVIDGTNASDDEGDRPGMRALQEMQVLSPLKICGLRKEEIRRLSREAGLFTWNKPSYACLATRIETGVTITAESLKRVEQGEAVLREMGFTDLRLRKRGENAWLQVPPEQMEEAVRRREEIRIGVGPYFEKVLLDLEGRRSQ